MKDMREVIKREKVKFQEFQSENEKITLGLQN